VREIATHTQTHTHSAGYINKYINSKGGFGATFYFKSTAVGAIPLPTRRTTLWFIRLEFPQFSIIFRLVMCGNHGTVDEYSIIYSPYICQKKGCDLSVIWSLHMNERRRYWKQQKKGNIKGIGRALERLLVPPNRV